MISEVEKWGARNFNAQIINRKKEGYYVLVNFSGNPDSNLEIERQMRINENVVRHMITLYE